MNRASSWISFVVGLVLFASAPCAIARAADEAAPAEAPKAEAKAEAHSEPAGEEAHKPDQHAADSHAAGDHGADAHGAGAHGSDPHAAGDHGEVHETGLPMNFKGDLALWSLVTFLLFVFVLKQFAWGPLAAALDQREAGIRKDIADAEASRVKSEALLKDYETKLAQAQEEVKSIIAEARRDADHTRQEIMATAQREAEATRQRAVNDIEQARDAALGELFDFVSRNVVQATEQVLQRSLSGEDHERLVREAMSQMDVRKN